MQTHRFRPIRVHAEQFTGDPLPSVPADNPLVSYNTDANGEPYLACPALVADRRVTLGDWLVFDDPQGGARVYTDGAFLELYEPIPDEAFIAELAPEDVELLAGIEAEARTEGDLAPADSATTDAGPTA
jgi:hypothetical protein